MPGLGATMPEPDIEQITQIEGTPLATVVSGLWSLGHDGIVLVDDAWPGPPVVLAPTEQLLMLAVDLPLASRSQRLSALPFAIEDQVSEPLDAVHAALGALLAPGRYLAGVVRHDRMRRWCAMMAEAGLGQAALVPDALALPSPGPGFWSVAVSGERALVRTADGPGFALPTAQLSLVWENSGRPLLVSYGEPLPEGLIGDAPGPGWTPLSGFEQPPALDLRQGPYVAAAASSPLLRRLILVLGIGILAHAAIYVVDTVALMRAADQKRAEVAVLVTAAGGPAEGDLAATAERMLPQGSGSGSDFLPLFSRASTALLPVGAGISLQTVGYGGDRGLTLGVEASDLAGLQGAEAALKAAGLNPASGGSSVDAGRATQDITLRGTPARQP